MSVSNVKQETARGENDSPVNAEGSFAPAQAPVFQSASLEIVCGQCGFELVLPADSTVQIRRCPRCWMQWNVDLSEPDGDADYRELPESSQSNPIVEFREAGEPADEVPQRVVKYQPLIIAKPDEEQEDSRNLRKELKEWFAGYGVSLAVHALLLFLGTLFVFQQEILHWGNALELSLEEGEAALGEMGGVESLELPEFATEQIESTDIASKLVFDSKLGGSGINQGTAKGAGDGNVGFFGTHARGRSFAFIVDCSGSMGAYFDAETSEDGGSAKPRSRLERAKVELLEALRAMKEDQSFSLVFYDQGSYWMSDLPDDPRMITATRENIQLATAWIKRQTTRGGTDPRDALERSLSLNPDVVFLLTDGQIPPETREVVAKHNKSGAVVHTTCIGAIENPILQLISDDHRGVFRPVLDDASERYLGVALVTITSSKSAEILKFSAIKKKHDRLLEKSTNNQRAFAKAGTTKVLYLHNAISSVPEFNLELQKLIRSLNSGTISGMKETFHPGLLGYDLPLGEKYRDFLSEQEIHDRRAETMTVEQFLRETVGSSIVGEVPLKIDQVYLEGDLDSNGEISNALNIYNLYHESELQIDITHDD